MSGKKTFKSIGVYGGTFNPIHYGHLINVELVREEFSLDKVFLVPTKTPVHKEISHSISPDDRYEMVKKSIQDNSHLDISRIELDRIAPSYTILTLTAFRDLFPDTQIYLIVGLDAFNTIDSWKSHEEILRDYSIIVMARQLDITPDQIAVDCHNVTFFNNPNIDISSTVIRERICKDKSIKYMTPDSVIKYINERELYRN